MNQAKIVPLDVQLLQNSYLFPIFVENQSDMSSAPFSASIVFLFVSQLAFIEISRKGRSVII